jgi:hypothetical protein
MSFDITLQPVKVLVGSHDSAGRLIFADGQLSAVIVRLDRRSHVLGHKERWHLEAGFGKCDVRDARLFKTPAEAGAWAKQTLMSKARVIPMVAILK